MPDLRRVLRLDEPPVLAQQLALICNNLRSTVWSPLLIVALLRVSLSPFASATALNLWSLAVVGISLNIRRMVRKHDRQAPLNDAQARRLVAELFIGSAVGGALWSALLWVLSPEAGIVAFAAGYALMAALVSGAVSTMAPVLSLFLAFLLPNVLGVVLHAARHGAFGHTAVALVAALFYATLLDQALRSFRAARSAIRLRFDNDALLERVREEHALADEAWQQAQQASEAKSRVLAAASHDLRQPLHAHGLFLELLAATETSPRQRDLIQRMEEAQGASAALLGSLFDYSRIEAGVIEPRCEPVGVQALLNRVEREWAPQADAKGLVYRTHESSLVLDTDPALLEQMLRNLVSNAIRYTERGGLLVACRRRGREAWLEVWDTGVGIAPEHQGDVFREFHQLDNPERDRHKGFGLGLAIVDGLARTLGHDLTLRSVPGRGSVFRLRVPLSATDALQPPPRPTVAASPRILRVHVLLLDDDPVILQGMSELLRSWGCSCDTAETVSQARDLARQRAPELLLFDHRLRQPGSGLEAIAELRAALGRPPPALLLTGDTGPQHLRDAAAAGVGLLHKPIAPEPLFREMMRALNPAQDWEDTDAPAPGPKLESP